MIKGLRKRPTYDEVAEIVENNVDIIKSILTDEQLQ